MDKLMGYMNIDGWNTGAYKDVVALKKVEPRWIPTDPLMEISHAVRETGSLTCDRCHGSAGVFDWRDLGYSEDEIKKLEKESRPGGK